MKPLRYARPILASMLIAVCGFCVTAAPAEEAPQPPPARGGGPPWRGGRDGGVDRADQPPPDEAGLRRMIQRRLEQLGRETQRLEEAQKRLEKGDPVDEIARDLAAPRQGPDDEPGPRGFGPGGPPGGPEGGNRPMANLTPAEREELIAAIREHAPLLAKRMEEGRLNEPGMMQGMLRRIAPRVREALSYRRTDPEMFQLKMQDLQSGGVVLEAVQTYRKTLQETGPESAAKTAQALADLRTALLQQFDARLAVQTREADNLAKRLESMRKGMDKRKESRDAEVDAIIEKIKAGKDFREPGPPPEADNHPGPPGGPGPQ